VKFKITAQRSENISQHEEAARWREAYDVLFNSTADGCQAGEPGPSAAEESLRSHLDSSSNGDQRK
jgi:hypothetical protein